ncbi:dihydroxyacetone kinase phosphoryl donor subunit DhaM [Cellulomonas sp. HZM]|uniref:dihydroxyacetone kinase phosphoryl donor subunit DhaM n=1 Tax=Cellulomonas sp. HZM TaxID=1454010 RepID=UPI00068C871A|nr:dihydroxyacetone kinase phosphoryl donor subunit DhaM [Cellulomonas sp. HZM]
MSAATGPVVAGGQGDAARVALVLVSHSRALAAGAVELAAQMAPGVLMIGVGGTADGRLGTDFDGVEQAVTTAAEGGRGVVLVVDLGSAAMTAESVLDAVDDDVAARARIADAPFVEGAVAAAVTAHGGADLEAVLAAAHSAGGMYTLDDGAGSGGAGSDGAGFGGDGGAAPDGAASAGAIVDGVDADGVVRATRTLLNPMGLHARPAAQMSRMLAGYDAKVTVNGVNAASVLALMKLGATQGTELHVEGRGPEAQRAVAAFVAEVERGFGEL